MSNRHGAFIWYELLTSDADAAQRFYQDVVGWTFASFGGTAVDGPQDYRILSAPDGDGVAGLMKLPDGAPMGPGWYGYIGVDDVDATIAAITADGAAIQMPATDLEGVGRIAMVTDPQGAPIYVMRGSSPEASNAFKPDGIGHGVWNELVTSDPAAAMSFYTTHFGWKKDGEMPMGDMGAYEFLSHDGGMIGAMMRGHERPAWGYFFRVGAIDPVVDRIRAAGGTMLHGPHQVPGGDWVVQARDPQGAMFGVVGSRSE